LFPHLCTLLEKLLYSCKFKNPGCCWYSMTRCQGKVWAGPPFSTILNPATPRRGIKEIIIILPYESNLVANEIDPFALSHCATSRHRFITVVGGEE
jgi:hypothetical protein